MKKQNKKQNELYPNCSEMTFRLTGDLEEIRKQMYNMVRWVQREYTGEYGDGPKEKLRPEIKEQIKELKVKIKEAKSLEDFEQIVIEFTCNYETFFKKDGEDLLVATCNNYSWDNVDKEEIFEEEMGYYDVAGYTSYILTCEIQGYKIYKREYDDEEYKDRDIPKFIIPEKDYELFAEDGKEVSLKDSAKIVIRGDKFFTITKNHLERIPELKDEILLNKLKLLMNLENK